MSHMRLQSFANFCEVCLGDLLVEVKYYVYIYIVSGVMVVLPLNESFISSNRSSFICANANANVEGYPRTNAEVFYVHSIRWLRAGRNYIKNVSGWFSLSYW